MFCLPRKLSEESEIWSFDAEGQTSDAQALIALAETGQDIYAALERFLGPVDDQSAEITQVMAECLSISSALRTLEKIIGPFPYHRRYREISHDLITVKDSLNYTFRDI